MSNVEPDRITIEVDPDVCCLYAQCVAIAPEVFEITDEALEWERSVDVSQRALVEEAVSRCPSGAISIVEEES
jgi:ferredoxin